MPVERDVDERVWCPGPWPWEWFDTCIERNHKWCYNFSWLKKTGYVLALYFEGCENGTLYTWWEFGFGLADQGTIASPPEMCFDSPRDSEGRCDSSNTGLAASPLHADQTQAEWRFCRKCYTMFFDGYRDKGICRADAIRLIKADTFEDVPHLAAHTVAIARVGGKLHVRMRADEESPVVDVREEDMPRDTEAFARLQRRTSGDNFTQVLPDDPLLLRDLASMVGLQLGHVAAGLEFTLPHDIAPSQWAQTAWRFCAKCHELFFDGYANKGKCPGGGGHLAAGLTFVLPHDVPPTPTRQKDWRYCSKCHALFFNGYASKGQCPGTGQHLAQGYNFVPPHK